MKIPPSTTGETAEEHAARMASDEAADDLLGKLRDGAWLDQQKFAPIAYAVPGIIPEGATVLAGAPKTGKSYLMLAITLAVATGGHALGHLPVGDARPVLYLALEDSDRRLQDRCRQILRGKDIPAEFQYLTAVRNGRCVDTIAQWLDLNKCAKPVVVVDTLGRVMPTVRNGETTYQRDYRAIGSLQSTITAHTGAALVVVHHTRKAGADDYADRISGTQGILGAADTGIVLSRSRTEQKGLLSVTGRDVEETEYGLVLTDGVWLLDGSTLPEACAAVSRRRATDKLGDRSTDIFRFVEENPGAGPTLVGQKFGLNANDAGNYLKRMADTGRLVRLARGKYAVCTVSTLSTVSTQIPGRDSARFVPLRSVESDETVETAGGGLSVARCAECADPLPEGGEPGDICWDCGGDAS